MSEELPFRCSRCGSFVGAERLYEADDYGPKRCTRCHKKRTELDSEMLTAAETYSGITGDWGWADE